jgi:hypothetical protein
MDRKEVISVLKDIFDQCTGMDGNCITLIPSKAQGQLAKGYQIHITDELSDEARECRKRYLRHIISILKRRKGG